MHTKNKIEKDKYGRFREFSPSISSSSKATGQFLSPSVKTTPIPDEKARKVLDKTLNLSNYRLSSQNRSKSKKASTKSVEKKEILSKYVPIIGKKSNNSSNMYSREKSLKQSIVSTESESKNMTERRPNEERYNYMNFFNIPTAPTANEPEKKPDPITLLEDYFSRLNSSPNLSRTGIKGYKTPQHSSSQHHINFSRSPNRTSSNVDMFPIYSRSPSYSKLPNKNSDYFLRSSITDVRFRTENNQDSPFKKMLYDLINTSKRSNAEKERDIFTKSFDKNMSISIEKSRKSRANNLNDSLERLETVVRSVSKNNSRKQSPAKNTPVTQKYNLEDLESETKYVLECLQDVSKKLGDSHEREKKKNGLKTLLLMEMIVSNCLKMTDIAPPLPTTFQTQTSDFTHTAQNTSPTLAVTKFMEDYPEPKGSIKTKIDTMKQIEAKLKELDSKRSNLRERKNLILGKTKSEK